MTEQRSDKQQLQQAIDIYMNEYEKGFSDSRLARTRICEYISAYPADEFIKMRVHRYNLIKRGRENGRR